MYKSQSGFISVELLLALALVMLLSAAAISQLSATSSSMKAQTLKNDISSLGDDIRAAFRSRPDYTGLNNQVIKDFGLEPSSFKGFSGPGGSVVTISPGGTGNRFFVIEFSSFKDVDEARSTCINLIPGSPSSWDAIVINGTPYQQGEFIQAANACSSSNRMALRGE